MTDIVLLAALSWHRYKLSFRDIADLLRQRVFDATHETIGGWEIRFAPLHSDQLLSKRRESAGVSLYLDESYVRVAALPVVTDQQDV